MRARPPRSQAERGRRGARRRELLATPTSGDGRWLAGQLLDYHRREAKPVWWAFFDRSRRRADELVEDDAEAIGGLEPDGEPEPAAQVARLHASRFPAQQHKLAPATRSSTRRRGEARNDRRARRRRDGHVWLAARPKLAGRAAAARADPRRRRGTRRRSSAALAAARRARSRRRRTLRGARGAPAARAAARRRSRVQLRRTTSTS